MALYHLLYINLINLFGKNTVQNVKCVPLKKSKTGEDSENFKSVGTYIADGAYEPFAACVDVFGHHLHFVIVQLHFDHIICLFGSLAPFSEFRQIRLGPVEEGLPFVEPFQEVRNRLDEIVLCRFGRLGIQFSIF
jgi:hypothetical protein